MEAINIEELKNTLLELAVSYTPKLLLALLTLIVGFWLISRLSKGVSKLLKYRDVEKALRHFLVNLLNATLKILLVISVATMVGIATTSFIAMLGAAGLAVGLALQGSLSNFAGGVIILFFKPFKIGDVIEAQGFVGRIKEIQIFNTVMLTLDNQRVILPNGILSNGCIKNIFAEATRRVDVTFGISYEDDIAKAKSVLQQVIDSQQLILSDHDKEIYVSAHADSSVNLLVRVWTESENYWAVYFDLFEKVKIAFDENNISIPFPQRDVHIIQN